MTNSRPPMLGLHHVALQTVHYEQTRSFYIDVMGMSIEWEPDTDNVYLTSGTDNLAIHRVPSQQNGDQCLDHIGFVVGCPNDVDAWHVYLVANEVEIDTLPRTHRDGARSFYCIDPAGVRLQVIYHPPLSDA